PGAGPDRGGPRWERWATKRCDAGRGLPRRPSEPRVRRWQPLGSVVPAERGQSNERAGGDPTVPAGTARSDGWPRRDGAGPEGPAPCTYGGVARGDPGRRSAALPDRLALLDEGQRAFLGVLAAE